MATVYADLSYYVEPGYVTTGYVQGEPLTNTFTVTADLTEVTGNVVEGSADLTASFTQTTDGNIRYPAAADLTASFTQTTAGVTTVASSSSLSISFTQTTAGVVTVVGGTITISAFNGFSCTAKLTRVGDVELDVSATQSTTGVLTVVSGDLSIGLGTTWNATASPILAGTSNITSSFGVTVDAVTRKVGQASLTANFGLSGTGEVYRIQLGEANLTSTFALTSGSTRFVNVSANLEADFRLTTDSPFPDPCRILVVRDTRILNIKPETRVLPVRSSPCQQQAA